MPNEITWSASAITKMQRSLCLHVVVVLTMLVAIPAAIAGPRENLLALDHQPTIADIYEVFGGKLPPVNPFGQPTADLPEKIRANAPAVIAVFEKAFPGATFAPLGRDSVFLGDIFDAFYTHLGQKRIVRASASGASRTTADDSADFIQGLGLDLEHLQTSRPFVMFDQTNFKSTSQSVSYLKAIYARCQKIPNCHLEELVEKFNFLNTGPARNMYAENVIDENFDIAEFLTKVKKSITFYGPNAIMSVAAHTDLVYTAEYHETFTKFFKSPDGKVTTHAGAMNSDAQRLQILADVFAAAQVVSSPSFLADVKIQAKIRGYNFPEKRIISQQEADTIRSGRFDSSNTVALAKLIDESFALRIEDRIKRRLSAEEHLNALDLDVKAYNASNEFAARLAALKSAARLMRVKQLTADQVAIGILKTAIATDMTKNNNAANFAHVINSSPYLTNAALNYAPKLAIANVEKTKAGLAKLEDIFKNGRIENGTRFREAVLRPQLEILEKTSSARLDHNVHSGAIQEFIVNDTTALAKSYPAEAWLLAIKINLSGVARKKLNSHNLADTLRAAINANNVDEPAFRAPFLSLYKRSSVLRQAFDDVLLVNVRKNKNYAGSIGAKYQSLYLEAHGISREAYLVHLLAAKFEDLETDKVDLLARGNTIVNFINASAESDRALLWAEALKLSVVKVRDQRMPENELAALQVAAVNAWNLTNDDWTSNLAEALKFTPELRDIWSTQTLGLLRNTRYAALAPKVASLHKAVFGQDSDPNADFVRSEKQALQARVALRMKQSLPPLEHYKLLIEDLRELRRTNNVEGLLELIGYGAIIAEQHQMDASTLAQPIQEFLGALSSQDQAAQRRFVQMLKKSRVLQEAMIGPVYMAVRDKPVAKEKYQPVFLAWKNVSTFEFQKFEIERYFSEAKATHYAGTPINAEKLFLSLKYNESIFHLRPYRGWSETLRGAAGLLKEKLITQSDFNRFFINILGSVDLKDPHTLEDFQHVYRDNYYVRHSFDGPMLDQAFTPSGMKLAAYHEAYERLKGLGRFEAAAEIFNTYGAQITGSVNAVKLAKEVSSAVTGLTSLSRAEAAAIELQFAEQTYKTSAAGPEILKILLNDAFDRIGGLPPEETKDFSIRLVKSLNADAGLADAFKNAIFMETRQNHRGWVYKLLYMEWKGLSARDYDKLAIIHELQMNLNANTFTISVLRDWFKSYDDYIQQADTDGIDLFIKGLDLAIQTGRLPTSFAPEFVQKFLTTFQDEDAAKINKIAASLMEHKATSTFFTSDEVRSYKTNQLSPELRRRLHLIESAIDSGSGPGMHSAANYEIDTIAALQKNLYQEIARAESRLKSLDPNHPSADLNKAQNKNAVELSGWLEHMLKLPMNANRRNEILPVYFGALSHALNKKLIHQEKFNSLLGYAIGEIDFAAPESLQHLLAALHADAILKDALIGQHRIMASAQVGPKSAQYAVKPYFQLVKAAALSSEVEAAFINDLTSVPGKPANALSTNDLKSRLVSEYGKNFVSAFDDLILSYQPFSFHFFDIVMSKVESEVIAGHLSQRDQDEVTEKLLLSARFKDEASSRMLMQAISQNKFAAKFVHRSAISLLGVQVNPTADASISRIISLLSYAPDIFPVEETAYKIVAHAFDTMPSGIFSHSEQTQNRMKLWRWKSHFAADKNLQAMIEKQIFKFAIDDRTNLKFGLKDISLILLEEALSGEPEDNGKSQTLQDALRNSPRVLEAGRLALSSIPTTMHSDLQKEKFIGIVQDELHRALADSGSSAGHNTETQSRRNIFDLYLQTMSPLGAVARQESGTLNGLVFMQWSTQQVNSAQDLPSRRRLIVDLLEAMLNQVKTNRLDSTDQVYIVRRVFSLIDLHDEDFAAELKRRFARNREFHALVKSLKQQFPTDSALIERLKRFTAWTPGVCRAALQRLISR